jgi:hypothetical protein
MTDALRDRLQESLGTAYALERELGGGGMSRVFLAEETRFGRRVVITPLSPKLAQGLSAERFDREIGLAARLRAVARVPHAAWMSTMTNGGTGSSGALDAGGPRPGRAMTAAGALGGLQTALDERSSGFRLTDCSFEPQRTRRVTKEGDVRLTTHTASLSDPPCPPC